MILVTLGTKLQQVRTWAQKFNKSITTKAKIIWRKKNYKYFLLRNLQLVEDLHAFGLDFQGGASRKRGSERLEDLGLVLF